MKRIRYNIITFPGSNCDHDSYYIAKIRNNQVNFIWHKEHKLKNPDIVILPGGFSYGDYLRSGALAKFSPIISEVIEFAEKGGLVLGICNGFQILTETGLLPGTLMMNDSLKFICKHQYIKSINNNLPFSNKLQSNQVLDIPIAHKDGNYFADEATLQKLQKNNQIVFKYCDRDGKITSDSNPNGSLHNIAGICNQKGNVLGMMPHPERAAENIVVSQDGKSIFESIEGFFH